jgi:hypothetical protein
MAAICRFWRISPSEYWAMTGEETAALMKFQADEIRARQRAQAKAERQSRIRRRG